MMMDKLVYVEYNGHFAILHMCAGANQLNLKFVNAMHQALDKIEQNEDARVLITTSSGKFYCNGLDLNWLKQQPQADLDQFLITNSRLLARILTFPMPTVAAINGHAFAAGAIIALAHDYRVMRHDRGWLSLSEVLVNVRFHIGWLQTCEYKISNANCLREAVLFGKRFTANDCIHYNIIDACGPQELLLQSSKTLIREKIGDVSKLSRKMVDIMKRDLYRTAYKSLCEVKPKL